MPLTSEEVTLLRMFKDRVRNKTKARLNEVSAKITKNIEEGRGPYDGLDPMEPATIGLDIMAEELFDLIKDRLRVNSGIAVSGGETTEDGLTKFI